MLVQKVLGLMVPKCWLHYAVASVKHPRLLLREVFAKNVTGDDHFIYVVRRGYIY
jgi:hypothetical protein